MFNFKQALLYKIEKKGKYETQYINDYNSQEQVLFDDGFLKDNDTDNEYILTEEITNTHNIITRVEIIFNEIENQYTFRLLQSKQVPK